MCRECRTVGLDLKRIPRQALVDIIQHSQPALAAGFDLAGSPNPQIDSMIVLDRAVDLITPLCLQLTYEGLVDECFGISSSG